MSQKDPRDEKKAHPFHRNVIDSDQLPPDYYSIVSLLFGVVGVMMKSKVGAWLALFSCMGSIANMRSSEMDLKQLIFSVMFSSMGIVINYYDPKTGV